MTGCWPTSIFHLLGCSGWITDGHKRQTRSVRLLILDVLSGLLGEKKGLFAGTSGMESEECLEMLEPPTGIWNKANFREK